MISIGYLSSLLIELGIFFILALGTNIIVGLAGQVTIAQAAFFGLGAFFSGIFSTQLHINFVISIIVIFIIIFILGGLLGMPSLRLSGDYLAIFTLGLGLFLQDLFSHLSIFGGTYGIVNIPMPTIFSLNPLYGYLIIVWIIVIILTIFFYIINKSWIGLSLKAIRENEMAARSMGINHVKSKIFAFSLGSAYAGLAGALFGHFVGIAIYSSFGVDLSVQALAMVIVGGLGTIFGSFVGAILFIFLPESLRFISDYRILIYGLLIILFMRFEPFGLFGERSKIYEKLKEFFR
ncbi:MAG: branched-chain amino acid ABC transporter permease [Thermoplasmata archaeon]|nr:branched-chain amino acid ABC transporter permease [Thermoplasmata archaeon]